MADEWSTADDILNQFCQTRFNFHEKNIQIDIILKIKKSYWFKSGIKIDYTLVVLRT